MKTTVSDAIPLSNLALPMDGRDHIQGPIDAPAVLLEYGDYECPFCGEFYPVIKAIQEQLGERLCFAFRNFPLPNSHPHAVHAAGAAEAAGAQGRFWEMHDLLFENQDALEDEDLLRYAVALGLDAHRVMADVLADRFKERIRQDFKSGTRAGVNGTPTLFINGERYDGPRGMRQLLTAIRLQPGFES